MAVVMTVVILLITVVQMLASRRLVHMSHDLRERLTAEGVLEAEPNPLYLPRHSLRLMIVGADLRLLVKAADDLRARFTDPNAAEAHAASPKQRPAH